MTRVRPMLIMLTVASVGLSTLGIAGCGKMGELERPAPRALASSAINNERNEPSAPGSVGENIDPATSAASIRQARLPGSGSDPFGGVSGPGFPGSGPR